MTHVLRLLQLLKTARKSFGSVRLLFSPAQSPRTCRLQQTPIQLLEARLILHSPCCPHQKQLGKQNACEFALHDGGYEHNG